MDVKIGKISFNLDSPDLANKDAFKKAFKDKLDVDAYWKILSSHKPKVKSKPKSKPKFEGNSEKAE